jgi:predicted transcriptional regulator
MEPARKRRQKGLGAYPASPVRLPPEIVEAIDKVAAKAKTTRSGLIRQFIEDGLRRAKALPRGTTT